MSETARARPAAEDRDDEAGAIADGFGAWASDEQVRDWVLEEAGRCGDGPLIGWPLALALLAAFEAGWDRGRAWARRTTRR